jgi:hypothetical protein
VVTIGGTGALSSPVVKAEQDFPRWICKKMRANQGQSSRDFGCFRILAKAEPHAARDRHAVLMGFPALTNRRQRQVQSMSLTTQKQ